jgi:hypothetical protein
MATSPRKGGTSKHSTHTGAVLVCFTHRVPWAECATWHPPASGSPLRAGNGGSGPRYHPSRLRGVAVPLDAPRGTLED